MKRTATIVILVALAALLVLLSQQGDLMSALRRLHGG
jgi:hypothetical protein